LPLASPDIGEGLHGIGHLHGHPSPIGEGLPQDFRDRKVMRMTTFI